MSATERDIVDEIIAYENGELDVQGVLSLFSYLISTGQAWSLQGSYGRAAQALIDNVLLTEEGELTDNAQELIDLQA